MWWSVLLLEQHSTNSSIKNRQCGQQYCCRSWERTSQFLLHSVLFSPLAMIHWEHLSGQTLHHLLTNTFRRQQQTMKVSAKLKHHIFKDVFRSGSVHPNYKITFPLIPGGTISIISIYLSRFWDTPQYNGCDFCWGDQNTEIWYSRFIQLQCAFRETLSETVIGVNWPLKHFCKNYHQITCLVFQRFFKINLLKKNKPAGSTWQGKKVKDWKVVAFSYSCVYSGKIHCCWMKFRTEKEGKTDKN